MDSSILNTQIDHYLIRERVKAGGVAIVYRAKDLHNNRDVAFKLLQSGWSEHPESIYRFQREAQIMQLLNHPHIVPYYGQGMYKGRPYIVMEYMRGGSLSERLKRIAQISLGGIAKLNAQMASALDYAHRKNIIHRDLKPGNILMRDETFAALTDFGIARKIVDHTMVTLNGQMPGTPHYMSPEQARGFSEIMPQSDQYSLAVIVYVLSTGRLPFGGSDALVIINQHLSAEPAPPSSRNRRLPSNVDEVLLKALSKDPNQRYETAGHFAQAYAQAIRGYERLMVTIGADRGGDHTDVVQSDVFRLDAVTPPALDTLTDNPIGLLSKKTRPKSSERWWLAAMLGVAFILFALTAVVLLNQPATARIDDPPTAVEAIETAAFTSWQIALGVMRDDTGTASRFNCLRFLEAFIYLQEVVSPTDAPDVWRLMADADSPVRTIYADYCLTAPDTFTEITPPSLVEDMRDRIDGLLQ